MCTVNISYMLCIPYFDSSSMSKSKNHCLKNIITLSIPHHNFDSEKSLSMTVFSFSFFVFSNSLEDKQKSQKDAKMLVEISFHVIFLKLLLYSPLQNIATTPLVK